MNDFQDDCIKQVDKLLKRERLHVNWQQIENRGERYLKGDLEHGGHRYELYIYENEAGIGTDGKLWNVCARPDFPDARSLIAGYRELVRKSVLGEWTPASQ